ncbi:hypothetical protein, partial [Hydromonas duriensis]
FNEFYIQSTQKNQMAVVNLLDAMLSNDVAAVKESIQTLQNIELELQMKKNLIQKEASASNFLFFNRQK